jgi:hypothetical protein
MLRLAHCDLVGFQLVDMKPLFMDLGFEKIHAIGVLKLWVIYWFITVYY